MLHSYSALLATADTYLSRDQDAVSEISSPLSGDPLGGNDSEFLADFIERPGGHREVIGVGEVRRALGSSIECFPEHLDGSRALQ